MAEEVGTRRFFNHIDEWRVGISASDYNYVTGDSGIGPVEWDEPDPYIRIVIPGAADPVRQLVGNADIFGWMDIRDYEAVTKLLYETDVTGDSEYAVKVTPRSRNTIGYFALVVANTEIVDATDARVDTTSTFSFDDVEIGRIVKRFTHPGYRNVWRIYFYADYVLQIDT